VRTILAGDAADAEKAESLRALGADAIPALIGAYESGGDADDWERKLLLGRLLVLHPYRRVAVLERSLGNESAVVRRVSGFVLADTGNADLKDRILEVFREWLGDRAFGRRLELVVAAAAIGNPLHGAHDPRSGEILIGLLGAPDDETARVRRESAMALGLFFKDYPGAKEALVKAARTDPEETVRARVLQSLAKHGWNEDLEAYASVADAEDYRARLLVAIALRDLADRRAEPTLEKLLGDVNEVVRRAALGGLAGIRSSIVTERAGYLREDVFMGVRGDLAEALQNLGAKEQVPVILEGLLDKEPDSQFNVLRKTVIALHQLTGVHHGFPDEYFERVERRTLDYETGVMQEWVDRPEAEKAEVLATWRKEFGEHDRRPHLLEQLRHADPANVARAVRELHLLSPEKPTPGFSRDRVEAATRDFDPRSAPFLALVDEAATFQALPEAEREKLLADWAR
jgi:HEAT repeat protein